VLAIIIAPWVVRVSYVQLTPPQPTTEFTGPAETVNGVLKDEVKTIPHEKDMVKDVKDVKKLILPLLPSLWSTPASPLPPLPRCPK
jgi:hypothetical protein